MGSNRPLYLDLGLEPENAALLQEVHPTLWRNPDPCGVYDLVIIGAGPAGLVAAKTAAMQKCRVALIERDMFGGDCFNVGCIPSKTLIRTARLYADMRNAENFGARRPADIDVDFPRLMQHMRQIRNRTSKRVSIHRLRNMNVDVFLGTATFKDSNSLLIDGMELKFRKALIATGSRPRIPRIRGLQEAGYLTNETLFNLKECPASMLVIGGGPLGCEMAQALRRFGSEVSIAQRDPMFLENIERDGAQILSNAMARDGVGIYLNAIILDIRMDGPKKIIDLISDDNKNTLEVEHILVSAGRIPSTHMLDLEKANVKWSAQSGLEINDFMQTSNPDIYAAGDVCPDHKFDHVQDGAARIAVSNALNGAQKKLKDLITPWCIYTTPEVAHVGLQVREARSDNIPVKTYTILMHQVDRAIADGEDEGFVKIHVKEGVDQILGATIVARHAGDIINYISMAMTAKLGLQDLADVSFPYPTQAQAIKMAALSYTGLTKAEMPLKLNT